jgi:hypothetical protein
MRIAGILIIGLAVAGLAGCKTPLQSCSQTN